MLGSVLIQSSQSQYVFFRLALFLASNACKSQRYHFTLSWLHHRQVQHSTMIQHKLVGDVIWYIRTTGKLELKCRETGQLMQNHMHAGQLALDATSAGTAEHCAVYPGVTFVTLSLLFCDDNVFSVQGANMPPPNSLAFAPHRSSTSLISCEIPCKRLKHSRQDCCSSQNSRPSYLGPGTFARFYLITDSKRTYLVRDSEHSEASGQGEGFLGAGDGHIHLPLVKAEVQGSNGRHSIHQ